MNPSPMLAAIDQVLLLVVFAVLAAASSWLTKRRQGTAGEAGPANSPAAPAAGEGQSPELETILRRLFSGEPTATAKPPPLPLHPASEPTPSEFPSEAVENPATPPTVRPDRSPLRPRLAPTRPITRAAVGRAGHPAPPLPATRPAVAKHLARRVVTCDGTRLVAQLRNPASARQAFLASQIFGPPKGMED
jgi:hypothetical protein